VACAALAVACALAAQILTITRHLNPENLVAVRAWYKRRIDTRGYPTRAATLLLLIAAVLAGWRRSWRWPPRRAASRRSR